MALFLQVSNLSNNSNILLFDNTNGLVLAATCIKLNNKGKINLCYEKNPPDNLSKLSCFQTFQISKDIEKSIKILDFTKDFEEKQKFSQ